MLSSYSTVQANIFLKLVGNGFIVWNGNKLTCNAVLWCLGIGQNMRQSVSYFYQIMSRTLFRKYKNHNRIDSHVEASFMQIN